MKQLQIGAVLILLLLIASCSKAVYVPVETVRNEYRYDYKRDSIFLSDSIIIRTTGDTVWLEKYRYMYRDRMASDTLLVNDTIRVPYPVVEVKEVNRLHDWQLVLMLLGGVAIGWMLFLVINKIKK